MNKNCFLIILVIAFLAITPQVFAGNLQILTSPDAKSNYFYVSNQATREINFKASYSFNNTEIKEGKAVYSYSVSPSDDGLKLELSTTEHNFTNDFYSTDILYIKTETLIENKTIQLRLEIFDKYNNLLETKVTYLKVIPNNSLEYYDNTREHTPPRFIGYNISRTVSIINGTSDNDVISITTKTQDNSSMFVYCSPSNEAVIVNQILKSNNQIDLNISIANNKPLETGEYFVSCYSSNNYSKQEFPKIKVIYTNKETTSKEVTPEIKAENKKTATSFIVLPKIKSTTTYILFMVFIVLILLSLFSKTTD